MRALALGNGSLRARIPAPFVAVMRALQLQGEDATMLRSLHDEEWLELLPMMDRAHLTLPVRSTGHFGPPLLDP
jgi:hypothetical protein